MKRRRDIAVAVLMFLTCQLFSAQDPGNPDGLLKGFVKRLNGENFTYHSPQPNVSGALLVRSIERKLFIEWETEPIPAASGKKQHSFIFAAAIDVNRENGHSWDISINDEKCFVISSPPDDIQKTYTWRNTNGMVLKFNASLTDMHGDQHGYMTLTVPAGVYEEGKPLKIKAEGESANSPTWFMIFRYAMEPALNIIEEQAVVKEGENEFQQVRVEYVYMGSPVKGEIIAGGKKTPVLLNFGYNVIRAKLPVVRKDTEFPVIVSTGKNNILATKTFTLTPVVPRIIHLLHHSHVDIGYTHVQEEVKQIQWKNLEDAIEYAKNSQSAPPEARFRWNSEVVWPIESYLRENSKEKADILRKAISEGWIGLDGLYSNILTELCTTEELTAITRDARRIAGECGVKLESAMITDIPGWSWGLVPVMARSGIKYLSLGTNHGHRIGGTIREWGDRPFYWVSPSGEEKILCWIHEKAYSMFHTGLKYENLQYRLDEGKIFGYLNELYSDNYPYEIVTLRYNIGSDNGPADQTLSDAVRKWNEKYVTPRIAIMTVASSFSEFEKRYGDKIPAISGAFTGYWEDGAASSASETALNRKAAATVGMASRLAVINNIENFTEKTTWDAWRNILLYDEHTWGSWNSISEPLNPFTLSQWETKRMFAVKGYEEATDLLNKSTGGAIANRGGKSSGVEVFNTHSWDITNAVKVPASFNPSGVIVKDPSGKIMPSQVLENGDLVFIAENVPALGSVCYSFSQGTVKEITDNAAGSVIENKAIRIYAGSRSGGIKSLLIKESNTELVDTTKIPGLNTYYYVDGRASENRFEGTLVKTEIIENGPVVKCVKTETMGKGSAKITNYYTIYEGIKRVYITTVIDKENVYTPEGVHLAFPFSVRDGVTRVDLAYAMYRTEADQVKAACKNYLTPERWVDISGQDNGVTLVTPDAPLIESGDITTDATAYGWIDKLNPSQTVYSYVMNNYWETNYKASQQGVTAFRYVLIPHGIFLSSAAERAAAEECEPLVAVPAGEGKQGGTPSLFRLKDNNCVVTGLVPLSDGYIIRLFNSSGAPAAPEINFREKPSEIFECDFDGTRTGNYTPLSIIPAWGIRNIRVRK